MGDRLTYTAGWLNALRVTLAAVEGQSNNATRDLVLGTDSYYTRYLYNLATRFEVTRAVRSVYSGANFVSGDDFPDDDVRGMAIPVRSTSWTPLWWGNGSSSYPYFQDYADADVVLFRGLAGSTYRLEGWFMDTSGAPYLEIHSLTNPTTSWSSYSGAVAATVGTTGWYVAYARGNTGPARWQGRIRVESGSDDLLDTIAEALPMTHGLTTYASSTAVGDTDAFQIHSPTSGTSLEILVSGVTSGSIQLFDPAGTSYGSHSITSSSTTWIIPSLPSAGHWTYKVTSNTVTSYSTNAWLGCGGGTSGCDVTPGTRATRYSWGDNFGGRLPTSTTEHVYTIGLAEAQGVSVSVSDTGQPCSVQISVYAPSDQLRFGGQPVVQWTDGAAVSDPGGNAQGAGGHVQAINAGTYQFRVRTAGAGTCAHYRIHFATSARRDIAMPAW